MPDLRHACRLSKKAHIDLAIPVRPLPKQTSTVTQKGDDERMVRERWLASTPALRLYSWTFKRTLTSALQQDECFTLGPSLGLPHSRLQCSRIVGGVYCDSPLIGR